VKKIELKVGDKEWLRKFENRLLFALYVAYLEARKGGKRGTKDEHQFELNADENLIKLRDDILAKTYRPSRSTAHIIHNPVIREIFAATFRDRVVHHLIFDTVYDWWDKRFIYDSYSCRVGKGTLLGVQRLDYHIRAVSDNYKKEVYVLKMDIQGYFMSLPRRELYERAMWGLDRQFIGRQDSKEYELIKFLWYQTIMDDPIHGVRKRGSLKGWTELPDSKSLFKQEPGKGIVIGNLTSQLLSNVYLDMLDRFIVYDLGYKYYGRYVDDFYIVVDEAGVAQLKKDIKAIEMFLAAKKLTLHPRKRSLRKSSQGVPFLGAVVYNNHIVMGERLKRNIRVACREVVMGIRDERTVVSYMGHTKYMASAVMLEKLFAEVGWEYEI
jgi:retron-type reverse transcriptase